MVRKKILRLSAYSWHTYNIYVRDGFFLHKLEVIAVCHVYVTQSGLKRPFHETRDMSSEREFCCSRMSQFLCGNEVKQGHKVQTNKL